MGAEKVEVKGRVNPEHLRADRRAAPTSPMVLERGRINARPPLRPRARAREKAKIEPAGITLPRKVAGVGRTVRSRIRDRHSRLKRNLGWVVLLGVRSLPGTFRRGHLIRGTITLRW